MGHISDHLRPNLTNVNATYAGPKPDDRYALKTNAGGGGCSCLVAPYASLGPSVIAVTREKEK